MENPEKKAVAQTQQAKDAASRHNSSLDALRPPPRQQEQGDKKASSPTDSHDSFGDNILARRASEHRRQEASLSWDDFIKARDDFRKTTSSHPLIEQVRKMAYEVLPSKDISPMHQGLDRHEELVIQGEQKTAAYRRYKTDQREAVQQINKELQRSNPALWEQTEEEKRSRGYDVPFSPGEPSHNGQTTPVEVGNSSDKVKETTQKLFEKELKEQITAKEHEMMLDRWRIYSKTDIDTTRDVRYLRGDIGKIIRNAAEKAKDSIPEGERLPDNRLGSLALPIFREWADEKNQRIEKEQETKIQFIRNLRERIGQSTDDPQVQKVQELLAWLNQQTDYMASSRVASTMRKDRKELKKPLESLAEKVRQDMPEGQQKLSEEQWKEITGYDSLVDYLTGLK